MNQQKIILVSGKGGVGKSTLAACLAQKLANEGQEVLLVRLCRSSSKEKASLRASTLFPGAEPFQVAYWMGLGCLQDYVTHVVKSSKVASLFFANLTVRRLLEVAPGLCELSILGKLTSGIRGVGDLFSYDVVVVDGYATGHTLSLLKAPVAMRDFFSTGSLKNPMGEQSSDILKVLQNKNIFKVVIATLPEEFSLEESCGFAQELEKLEIECEFWLNRVWPECPEKIKEGLWWDRVKAQKRALVKNPEKFSMEWPFIPYVQREELYRKLLGEVL